MKRRIQKKSEVLREGYIKGLRQALSVLNEALGAGGNKSAIDSFVQFVKANKNRYAGLIKVGEKAAASKTCRFIVRNSPTDTWTTPGLRACHVKHRIGYYKDSRSGEICIGALGGGDNGPYEVIIDRRGNVIINIIGRRSCDVESQHPLRGIRKKIESSQRDFDYVWALMRSLMNDLGDFEAQLEKKLS